MGATSLGKVKVGSGGTVSVKWDPDSKKVFVGPWNPHVTAKDAAEAIHKAEAFAAQK